MDPSFSDRGDWVAESNVIMPSRASTQSQAMNNITGAHLTPTKTSSRATSTDNLSARQSVQSSCLNLLPDVAEPRAASSNTADDDELTDTDSSPCGELRLHLMHIGPSPSLLD